MKTIPASEIRSGDLVEEDPNEWVEIVSVSPATKFRGKETINLWVKDDKLPWNVPADTLFRVVSGRS